MALQGSGQISLANIQTEFGGSNPISLSEYYRNGGYVTNNNTSVPTSGTISLNQFYNGRKEFAFTFSSNQTSVRVRGWLIDAGWNGDDPVVVTINAGVTIRGFPGNGGSFGASVAPYGQNPGYPGTDGYLAFWVDGSFPNGITVKNYGLIYGGGGGGGNGGSIGQGGPGGDGGAGFVASVPVTLYNYQSIYGGGGGGGGNSAWGTGGIVRSGGGGGGGANFGERGSGGNWEGIDGGPGGDGTEFLGGAGGYNDQNYAPGGAGGGPGQAGTTPYNSFNGAYGAAGGAAGEAIFGNSNITWGATGTLVGPIV